MRDVSSSPLLCFSLNVRGLNDDNKISHLFTLLKADSHLVDFFFVLFFFLSIFGFSFLDLTHKSFITPTW